ncbi:MAG: CoA-transferase, partial [Janthinobacterium lividum]
MAVNKIHETGASALAGLLRDGMLIHSGGFGLAGIPSTLIAAIRESGVRDLTLVSNDAGVADGGLGELFQTRQVAKIIISYVGKNYLFT